MLAGGIFAELDDGKLGVIGPKRLVSVEVGAIAPGARSWIATFDAAALQPPVPSYNYVVFGAQVQEGDPNPARVWSPRCRFFLATTPSRMEVFLVDGAGGFVDAFGSGAAIPVAVLRGTSAAPLLSP